MELGLVLGILIGAVLGFLAGMSVASFMAARKVKREFAKLRHPAGSLDKAPPTVDFFLSMLEEVIDQKRKDVEGLSEDGPQGGFPKRSA